MNIIDVFVNWYAGMCKDCNKRMPWSANVSKYAGNGGKQEFSLSCPSETTTKVRKPTALDNGSQHGACGQHNGPQLNRLEGFASFGWCKVFLLCPIWKQCWLDDLSICQFRCTGGRSFCLMNVQAPADSEASDGAEAVEGPHWQGKRLQSCWILLIYHDMFKIMLDVP